MNNDFEHFRNTIRDNPQIDPHDHRLLIERHDRFTCCYAPFEHVNSNARIVLLGITPGAQQARNAINALRAAMRTKISAERALEQAKQSASFSGPMRSNLVAMLDRIGMQQSLGIETCARLFDNRADLVHFTSALRYPVFLDGKDYSGSPPILATPVLRSMTQRWLGVEIAQLRDAFWIPLGKEPAAVLADCVSRGQLEEDRVLAGMPHPSGANAERIAYFLGTKNREDLSAKTNPGQLDAARERLVRSVTPHWTLPCPTQTAQQTVMPATPSAPIPNTTTTPSTARVIKGAGSLRSQTVAQAEALIAAQMPRIKAGNKKVAGFETSKGRHLAIQRDVQGINVWAEDLHPPSAIASFERYPADRRRHSNLDAQAPRVGNDRDARLWKIANPDDLVALLHWYDQA